MKKKFSNKWMGSKQKRKKVKYKANAPLHTKHKFLSANLTKDLRKKYKRRSFPLRKGDNIKIMGGKFKGKKGKILEIDLKNSRISVDGVQRTKKDGTKTMVFLDPSKVQITELFLDDKERTKKIEEKIKAQTEKPKTSTTQKLGEKNASK
jgi:large subunit ribosomal protein L24